MARFIVISIARSGSTLLCSLLRCHPQVAVDGEIFNDENEVMPPGSTNDTLLKYAETKLTSHSNNNKHFVGFRVTPEQLIMHKLRLDYLIRYLDISKVIILWRESVIETYVSLQIAIKTNVWYSEENATQPAAVELNPEDYFQYYKKQNDEWNHLAAQWPFEIAPHFISYEQLCANRHYVITELLFNYLQCPEISGIDFTTDMKKQNPYSIDTKISNWHHANCQISDKTALLVPPIFKAVIEKQLGVPKHKMHLVPCHEPSCYPSGIMQYRVAEPYLPVSARNNILDALDTNFISSASYWVEQMSRRLLNIFPTMKVAQPCCNGFTSLVLALQACDVGQGDEVVVPTFTMIAVSNSVWFVGGKPICVDNSSPQDYNPSIDNILSAATPKTKAVIVSHTYGVPMRDIEQLAEVCRQHNWWLIEDISECVGVQLDGRYLGTFGDFACASMYANKIIHAGDGGFVLARDPATSGRLQSLVNHGFTRTFHFVHRERAINAKINGLGAALACACLDNFEEIMKHRREITARYRKLLSSISSIELMPPCGTDDTAWVFGFVCKTTEIKDALRRHLALNYGIETRNFFFPIHLQPAYVELVDEKQKFPNAEYICNTGIYLPTHSNLLECDIDFIGKAVVEFFDSPDKLLPRQSRKAPVSASLRIDPKSLKMSAHVFDPHNVSKKTVFLQDHLLLHAVRLYQNCEIYLSSERRDEGQQLLSDIAECVTKANSTGLTWIEPAFRTFTDYIKSQEDFEQPVETPWCLESVEIVEQGSSTALHSETMQLLLWLVKNYKCQQIVDLGCSLLSHAAKFTALNSACKIYAFKVHDHRPNGFELENCHPLVDLVFIDLCQDAGDIEEVWPALMPFLQSGKTIIVISSLNVNILPFIVEHSRQLEPIAKPATTAKAFLYHQQTISITALEDEDLACSPKDFKKLLKFVEMPGWTHHHQNAFEVAISHLYKKYNDEKAPVLFIPAVEQYLVDEWSNLNQRWIGIVHGVPDYPEEFYVPDLRRLCTQSEFASCLELCSGIITLTKMQADFLRSNLPKHLRIPIQTVKLVALEPLPEFYAESYNADTLVLIGEFARDVQVFFKCRPPAGFRKVMLISGDEMKKWAKTAPSDVTCMQRLNGQAYESLLSKSVVILPLKYDGAANTILVECIARNVPILVNRGQAAMEYLGKDYPLFYNADDFEKNGYDLSSLLTTKRIELAIDYLKNMEKSPFSIESFLRRIENGAVLLSVPPPSVNHGRFDLTVCICSYKRTANLAQILHQFWLGQTSFQGSLEIIVWNNNDARSGEVRSICQPYLKGQTNKRSLQLIQSSKNHYCLIRLAVCHLMQSDELLICDDDVMPGSNMVSFFLNARKYHRHDVLCLRGAKFHPHDLNVDNPMDDAWYSYKYVRFIDDSADEQEIHFAHMDVCLIGKDALIEANGHSLAEPEFALVDDYWICYVLSHFHRRIIRKLKRDTTDSVAQRTLDADTKGLALHTRSDVRDARVRFYIHHMLNGWPKWNFSSDLVKPAAEELKSEKQARWSFDRRKPFVGFNISSRLSREDAEVLKKWGVRFVRIGSVGCKEPNRFEMAAFINQPDLQVEMLRSTIEMLDSLGINVVLTLTEHLASAELWKYIAGQFASHRNVIGYDLINEPRTEWESSQHWSEIQDTRKVLSNETARQQLNDLTLKFQAVITAIREKDQVTPIVVEASFWASVHAVRLLPQDLLKMDDNLIVSVHFYEPHRLAIRKMNRGRFAFPGEVPVFDCPKSETIYWDERKIKEEIGKVAEWADQHKVRVVIGECGCSREVKGTAAYFTSILESCRHYGIPAFVYSFRERMWEAMNYELQYGPPVVDPGVISSSMYGHERLLYNQQQQQQQAQSSTSADDNSIIKAILDYIT